jgi:hypothetical protein
MERTLKLLAIVSLVVRVGTRLSARLEAAARKVA